MSHSGNQLTMRDTLYFAYGSNMDWHQLRARCASARFLFSARLPDHQLAFTRWSPKRKCGVLDIVEARDAAVWGGVFRVDLDELADLDICEAVHNDGYRRKYVRVLASDDDMGTHEAITYEVANKREEPQRPDSTYMGHVIRGAIHCGLPPSYIDHLRNLASGHTKTISRDALASGSPEKRGLTPSG